MTSLFSPFLKTFILDIRHYCWKLMRTIFVSSWSMSSGCWKWLSLVGSCAIIERCHHEFKKNFLCYPREYLELVMHVRIIIGMTGCCLHLLENSYMHNKPLTNSFKIFTIFFHVLPTRTRLRFIAISSCWCNFLWAITILLIFSELYIVAISWESSNATRWHPLKLSIQKY
jgi:hypothetical protein